MDFKAALEAQFKDFFSLVSTDKGDWTVKGVIDVYRNIYTISIDTKVVSKIVELMIFPVILEFAKNNNYQFVLATHQNHYPDITFIPHGRGKKIALDLKSTYRIADSKVNGMTLGAFTGYFRNRTSRKNITFPYEEYDKHYILGIIYSRADLFNAIGKLQASGYEITAEIRKALGLYISQQSDGTFDAVVKLLGEADNEKREGLKGLIDDCLIDEKRRYTIDDLPEITSVVRDFDL